MGKRKLKKELSSPTQEDKSKRPRRLDNESGDASTSTSTELVVSRPKDERLLWGPYLSERQWGTVREDLSPDGNCWESFPHEQAVYRSYAWGEDGLMGICDDQAQLCLSLALWNGHDSVLKERLYGMTGPQGNHGEDVKECYFYLDSTASHTYMKALYKYPHQAFPYDELLEEAESRDATQPEYELLDTGTFDEGNYFDVYAEYAKRTDKDILCRYTVYNRGSRDAQIHILPQLWFRNTWSEGRRPCKIQKLGDGVICTHPTLGKYIFEFSEEHDPSPLYTENETNVNKMKKGKAKSKDVKKQLMSPTQTLAGKKDAFNEYVVHGNVAALNAKAQGTKFGVHYQMKLPARGHVIVKCRLVAESEAQPISFQHDFDATFGRRINEADQFYKQILPADVTSEKASMMRQAYAGLCWNKQFFYYDLAKWLDKGDEKRINQNWRHMLNSDVISMPDKWEFPWYATWDLAFHMIPMTDLDPEFVKSQLLLLLSERYMHPVGQLPAYEFDFSDVNPPVHAMAVLHVHRRHPDTCFLLKCFNKLALNFNWWLNNKQVGSTWLFCGGFLGMDNVSCMHRSQLPDGCTIYQVDGTCWMAYFALCMMQIALELCELSPAYVDMVIKYMDYFLHMAYALNFGLDGSGLWDEQDQFYYDNMLITDKKNKTTNKVLRVRAMIGLTSLFPVYKLPVCVLDKISTLHPEITQLFRLRKNIVDKMGYSMKEDGLFLSMFPRALGQRFDSVMRYMADEKEFLAPGGIRALSKFHENHPCSVTVGTEAHEVEYNSGESQCDMFGGNSNWRGPVWFPMNYLLLESISCFAEHVRESGFISQYVQLSDGSQCSLQEFARLIGRRLVSIFLPDKNGRRPCHGSQDIYHIDPHWKDLVLFYEYFDGDTSRGCGASHQTGWTALVATILKKYQR